jgi:hypothetical protein
MYIIRRVYHSDYRIATLFAKDLATVGTSGYFGLKKFELDQRFRNYIARQKDKTTISSILI